MKQGAAPDGGYCWDVAAMTEGTFGLHSGMPFEAICFHPKSVNVELLEPDDGETIPLKDFTIEWRSENPPEKYYIGVGCESQTFGATVPHSGGAGDIQKFDFPPEGHSPLKDGDDCVVSVCPRLSNGDSGDCDKSNVTARKPKPPLPAPRIAFPLRCVPDGEWFFHFTAVPEATEYEWVLERVATGNWNSSLGTHASGTVNASAVESPDVHAYCPDGLYGTIDTPDLAGGDWFRFRVRALNGSEASEWSEWGRWWIYTRPTGSERCGFETCAL
jgi:hypothetical protein